MMEVSGLMGNNLKGFQRALKRKLELSLQSQYQLEADHLDLEQRKLKEFQQWKK